MIRVASLTESQRQNRGKSDRIFMHNKQCKGDEKRGDTLEVAEQDRPEKIGIINDIRRNEHAKNRDVTVFVPNTAQSSTKTTDEDRKMPPNASWRSFDWSAKDLNKPPKIPSHLKPLKKPKEFVPEKRQNRFVVPYQRWLYLLIFIILVAVISYIANYIYSIFTVWMYYTTLLKNKYKNQTTTQTPAPSRRFLEGKADLVQP